MSPFLSSTPNLTFRCLKIYNDYILNILFRSCVINLYLFIQGTAAFWFNLHKSGEPDALTRHAACPVIVGTKWGKCRPSHSRDLKRPKVFLTLSVRLGVEIPMKTNFCPVEIMRKT